MNKKRTIHLVAGARPNFMKIAPLFNALSAADWANPLIVHTGQHYSREMSAVFFEEFNLPEPSVNLEASGSTHGTQTASVMVAYENLCREHRPDCTVVVGDVNSTLAAALAAKKENIPLVHLEAGLRSRDRTMPEEINRLAVDAIADLLWPPSFDAVDILRSEGVAESRIDCVGNFMIDCLHGLLHKIRTQTLGSNLGLEEGRYIVATFHRPSNVDSREQLSVIVSEFVKLTRKYTVVFPVHPRTRSKLHEFNLFEILSESGVHLLEPLGYMQFLGLVSKAAAVVTDSGGIQEETTYLGVPCLTARESTERPITLELGTNQLVALSEIYSQTVKTKSSPRMGCRIPLWDGAAASRAVLSLEKFLCS
jgi:UDP-N-acetylglucosamine 2-epimerase (non-hydrolysing)